MTHDTSTSGWIPSTIGAAVRWGLVQLLIVLGSANRRPIPLVEEDDDRVHAELAEMAYVALAVLTSSRNLTLEMPARRDDYGVPSSVMPISRS